MTRNIHNGLSIDVEDYFQVSNFASFVKTQDWDSFPSRVEKNTYELLELFAEYNVKGTFFTLGWVAERYPNIVKEIHKQGHEVASHGYWHQLVYDQTPEEFREDIHRSKVLLEDLSGDKVLGYRAPSYSITNRSLWALDVLISEGFTYDSSIFPIHHDRYGIPDAPRYPYLIQRDQGSIMEFPMATVTLGKKKNVPMAGGGYFRLFPYAITRWGLKKINAQQQGFAFYLHPWEIDPKQPRFNEASALSRFRHYINLHSTKGKLRRLIQDFTFVPIKDVLFSDKAAS